MGVRRVIPAAALAALVAGIVAAAGASSSAPRSQSSAARRPHRILVLTQTRGYRHASIPAAAAALRRLAGALPATFAIHEEFYVFKQDPRPRVHVLARLDIGPTGRDRPLVWCQRFGRGRVFYDALGHFIQTWRDSRQLDLARGGLEWAGGLVRAGRC